MSTRCLYGFTKDGDFKLAYNHDDSYPRGFGKSLFTSMLNYCSQNYTKASIPKALSFM